MQICIRVHEICYVNIFLHLSSSAREKWSLKLREEYRLRAFENRILRRIIEPKRDENGEWRRLHNLYNSKTSKTLYLGVQLNLRLTIASNDVFVMPKVLRNDRISTAAINVTTITTTNSISITADVLHPSCYNHHYAAFMEIALFQLSIGLFQDFFCLLLFLIIMKSITEHSVHVVCPVRFMYIYLFVKMR